MFELSFHARSRMTAVAAGAVLGLALLCARVQAQAVGVQPPSPDDQWAAAFQDFERADAASPTLPGGVVFVGSSSIRLWSDMAKQFTGWPTVINRGFGGSELADCARHVQRLVSLYQPRLVLVYAGDNDLAAGRLPHQVLESYQAFVAGVRERQPGLPVVFISIKPSPSRAKLMPSVREANRLIRDYTDQGKNLYFVDVFTPMLGPDGEPRAELFKPDALHLNQAGYALWQSTIVKSLPPNLLTPAAR
ncbi:MAG: GDSL family lipase [Leptothrix sp. (in: Bacteria)]|nr:GDSL family lipase [Leptothrix sp. (in: b-proteobacteria)]